MNNTGLSQIDQFSPEATYEEGVPNKQNVGVPILLEYWHVLLRGKWVILGLMISALAVGIIATLLATPQYTATARIEISRETQNVTPVEGIENPQASKDDEFYQTQYSNLQARSLAQRVAQQLRLSNNEAFFAAHGKELKGGLLGSNNSAQAGGNSRQERLRQAVDLLLEHVVISPINRSRLVDISYSSSSPDMSTLIANAWVEQYIASTIDRRFDSTVQARKFLEERLQELGRRLEQSERDAVAYAAVKNIVPLAQRETPDGKTIIDSTLVSANLEALNSALASATADRITAQSRADTHGSTAEATNNIAISNLRQKRAEAKAEYATLMVQFEPGYPQARALQENIESLNRAIANEEGRVASMRSSEYREALARENDLLQRVNRLKAQLSGQRRDQIKYNVYQREADTNRQLYDSLLQRYKEIGVASIAVSNVSVVDMAIVPEAPSSPNLLLNLALAFVTGLGLSFLALVALEQIDEGLHDPSSVGRLLQLPLLGAVPVFSNEEDRLTELRDPKSTTSEAYFSIQSNLSFTTENGFPRTLMTTSTRPAEGKTTTAVALASAVGRTGKKVLLIDADMRSPSCHHFFELPNKEGLSNLLIADKSLAEVIQQTDRRNLSLISAGPTPPSASELLSGERLGEILEAALKTYDYVLLDSPPLLGLADAPLISRSVEGAVFVIEADGVAVRSLRSALTRLEQAHTRVFGAIVTKVDVRRAGYGDGYGYGYGYGTQNA